MSIDLMSSDLLSAESVMAPAPVTAAPAARDGAQSVAELLAETAWRVPQRLAVVGEHSLTFAELDAAAWAYADRLRPLLSRLARPIAISSAPHPSFLAAYYGAMRAGAVVVPLNPMLPDAAVSRVLEQSGASIALLAPSVRRRVLEYRRELPELTHLYALWDDTPRPWDETGLYDVISTVNPDVLLDTSLFAATSNSDFEPTFTARSVPGGAGSVDDPAPDRAELLDRIGVVMFTSGTTGASKGAAITHRSVLANAAQFGDAHQITGDSVVLCHLPIVSPMHMNASVRAGATQLLCPAPEISDSARLANRHGATHYYSLPVRLGRLATNPELADIAIPSLRLIAAGNQTLSVTTIQGLADRFGIPVFQGYGLTESTHLAHTDGPVNPRPGSSGPAVAGSQSRIVDIDTRQALPAGALGELQIRGPQLMQGYINRPDLRPFDEDGWFSTGDVARLDEDGYLYPADRLVDVFRRDGQLVSVSRVERLIERQRAVIDAAVVDGPVAAVVDGPGAAVDGPAESSSERTPVAFVVPADASWGIDAVREALRAVNAELEAHERISAVVIVSSIRRSATNGKIERKTLRSQLDDAAYEYVAL